MFRLRVALCVLALIAAAAPTAVGEESGGDVFAGSEFSVDAPELGYGTVGWHELLWNGTSFLNVWTDTRDGFGPVRAVTVPPDGEALAARVAVPGRWWFEVGAARVGDSVWVVTQRTDDYWSDEYGVNISRLSLDGEPLTGPVEIATTSLAPSCCPVLNRTAPAIAGIEGRGLVVWPGEQEILAVRLTQDSLIDTAPLRIPLSKGAQNLAIAARSDGYLLVWQDDDQLEGPHHALLVDPDGAPRPGAFRALPTRSHLYGGAPSLTAGPGGYLLAWARGPDLAAIRLAPDGDVVDPEAFVIEGEEPGWQPDLASLGDRYVVTYARGPFDRSDVGMRSIGPGAAVGDLTVISAEPETQVAPSIVAAGPGDLGVAWLDLSATSTSSDEVADLLFTTIGADGSVAPADMIATATNAQRAPVIASGRESYLVAWRDQRGGGQHRLAAVGLDGTTLGPSTVVTNNVLESGPIIAAADDGYLAAWHSGENVQEAVRVSRVTSDGRVLDPGGMVVAAGDIAWCCPAMASDGRSFLVVWEEGFENQTWRGRIIHADGALGRVFDIVSHRRLTGVSFSAGTYLVTWSEPSERGTITRGTRIGRDGTPVGEPGAVIAETRGISVPADGGWIWFWTVRGNGPDAGIYAAPISADAVLDPGAAVLVAPGSVALRDAVRIGTRVHEVLWSTDSGAPRLTRIDDGRVGLPRPLGVDPFEYALTGGPGRLAFAYERRVAEPPYFGTSRVFFRLEDVSSFEPPETSLTTSTPTVTSQTFATFEFSSSDADARFICTLDAVRDECSSPVHVDGLSHGRHAFAVQAMDATAELDPTPSIFDWTVDTLPPVVEIRRPKGTVYVADQEVPFSVDRPTAIAVGALTVEALAADRDSGVAWVRFAVDGSPIDPSLVSNEGEIYRFVLRTGSAGTRRVSVRVTDGVGHTASDDILVSIVPLPA